MELCTNYEKCCQTWIAPPKTTNDLVVDLYKVCSHDADPHGVICHNPWWIYSFYALCTFMLVSLLRFTTRVLRATNTAFGSTVILQTVRTTLLVSQHFTGSIRITEGETKNGVAPQVVSYCKLHMLVPTRTSAAIFS